MTSGAGGKWQIASGSGFNPVWSGNGRDLFYGNGDRIMVVTYTIRGESFVAEKPRLWSEKRIYPFSVMPTFDIAPDGKRFAVVVGAPNREAQDTRHHVRLVLNFFEELRRRMAEGGR